MDGFLKNVGSSAESIRIQANVMGDTPYEEFRIACMSGSHKLHSDMNDREPGAFHEKCMKIDIHVWIKAFLKPWPDLMWLVVERLVRTHTNLHLEYRLELYEADMLPWDLEMTVEEPLSDDEDEDGVPHCVSDSESESENDSA
jgi:hypothetical protein